MRNIIALGKIGSEIVVLTTILDGINIDGNKGGKTPKLAETLILYLFRRSRRIDQSSTILLYAPIFELLVSGREAKIIPMVPNNPT